MAPLSTDPVPTAPTRVLVVDDSVVVRQLVARVLDAEPSAELAGVAANGRIALEKIALLQPDLVLLDLDMPVMDGFETLKEIRRADPALPVVVFSHLTAAGAAATLDALALGATGFALKPSADGIGMAQSLVRDELMPLLRALRPGAAVPAAPTSAFRPHPSPATTVAAVVIGVSTGGPNALADIIPALPADLPVPVFIVQHMPPIFTGLLAERLDRLAAVTVTEAIDGEAVRPGTAYVAPGGQHLLLTRAAGDEVHIVLSDDPPENSCRPAADVLFRSAAAIYGAQTLAVVLTGMGRDGLRGAEAVRAAGGHVIAQSEGSAVVASMPAAVTTGGLADAVVPLDQMAAELVGWIRNGSTDRA